MAGDRLDPGRPRLDQGDAEPEPQRVRRLPGLEAAGRVGQLELVLARPAGAAHVGGGGTQAGAQLGGDVEEAGAARGAEELATGGDQRVAADRADVDRQVADRLGRVEQVGDAGRAGEGADRGDRLDPARGGRHVGGDQQGRRLGQRPLQRPEVGVPGLVVGDDLDGDPGALELKQLQRRADVGRPGGEDAVAGAEPQRVDHPMPADRRALDQGDVVGAGADQLAGGGVDGVEPRSRRGRGLVAADLGLELEVVDDGGEGGGARQRRAGRVEVVREGALGGARRQRPLGGDVDRGGRERRGARAWGVDCLRWIHGIPSISRCIHLLLSWVHL